MFFCLLLYGKISVCAIVTQLLNSTGIELSERKKIILIIFPPVAVVKITETGMKMRKPVNSIILQILNRFY